MELRTFILILIVISLITSCWIYDEQPNIQKDIIGLWSLQSYARPDADGNIITASCPFDAAPGIADTIFETSNSDLDGDGYPDSYNYEYFVKINSSNIHSYYKVNHTGSYEGEHSITNFLSGLFYDEHRIDTYSIDPIGEITCSRDYISGMTAEISGDILTITGTGVIKLKKTTTLEINGAETATEDQFRMLDLLALCGLNHFLNNENSSTEVEIPSTSDILYSEMVPVTGGSFIQSTTPVEYFDSEAYLGDAYIPSYAFQHTVSNFCIGKYEVTYLLWYTVYSWAIASGYSFSNVGREGSDGGYISYGGVWGTTEEISVEPTSAHYEPVTSINWYDTIVWCNAYSVVSGRTPVYENSDGIPIKRTADIYGMVPNWSNNGFRLPTEGEWQFAATGGNSSNNYTYSGSNTIDDVAWYNGNSFSLDSSHLDYGTHNVGEKQANELGLYDMTGNVSEWCFDWYGGYPGNTTDYKGASSGSYRVIRGGGWTSYDYPHLSCEVSFRTNNLPYNEHNGGGFRLAYNSIY